MEGLIFQKGEEGADGVDFGGASRVETVSVKGLVGVDAEAEGGVILQDLVRVAWVGGVVW